jgi:phosphoglycerate dehydrogenase-like enzyme
MPKVLICPAPLADIQTEFVKVLKSAGFELVYPKRKAQMSEQELTDQLKGIQATLAGSEPYTRKVLQAHPQLKVIARAGVGYDGVDCPAASDLGVAVCIAPGTNHDAVAEHAFALILGLSKDVVNQHLGTIGGHWPRHANLPLRGRVLGIAGMGRIGKSMAVRGQAFGMKMLAFEPFPDHEFAKKYGVEFVTWERLLAESDFLSLHMPMTAESRHIIHRKTLALMKPSAFLVNTARGGLVNEADLLEALKSGKIAGVGLDVFEQEPPAVDNPLFKLKNVIMTPHAAGVDIQSRDDMALSAANAIVDLSRGGWPAEKIVNPEVRAKFRW